MDNYQASKANAIVGTTEREPTQMERVGSQLGQALKRLRDMNGALEARLDAFSPPPSVLGAQNASPAQPPEPMPGTAAYLHHVANRQHDELERLDSLICRLQAIF